MDTPNNDPRGEGPTVGDDPVAVDLFAGAGGASLGLEWAGFDVVAAVDINRSALQSHHENLPAEPIHHDLSEVRPDVLPASARSPDFVHGSPPCKGFSQLRGERDADDDRNSLVFDFIEWLGELTPSAATMENVTGMTTIAPDFMGRIRGAFNAAGYDITWREVNAANYGVAQTRERVITIAVRADLESPERWFPPQTHAETPTSTLDGRRLEAWRSVADALRSLPPRGEPIDGRELIDNTNGPHQRAGRRPTPTTDDASNTIRGGTAPELQPPSKDLPSPNEDGGIYAFPSTRCLSVVPNSFSSVRSSVGGADEGPSRRKKPNHDPTGWTISEVERQRAVGDREKGTIGGHAPNAPARTLRAGDDEFIVSSVFTDGGRGDASDGDVDRGTNENKLADTPDSGGTHGDGGESDDVGVRRLTPRECARLQSFPDWYGFLGSKTDQYEQIGNAVPPLLQYHIANHLKEVFKSW